MLGKTEFQGLTTKSALGGRLVRGFTMAGFLSKTELESLLAGAVKTTVIDGGAAGDHTVNGIAVGDALRAVLKLDVAVSVPADTSGTTEVAEINAGGDLAVGAGGNVPRAWDVEDLTGEFSIAGADTINNAGGTDTTGAVRVVVYEDLTP
jgi:hypothetical protein